MLCCNCCRVPGGPPLLLPLLLPTPLPLLLLGCWGLPQSDTGTWPSGAPGTKGGGEEVGMEVCGEGSAAAAATTTATGADVPAAAAAAVTEVPAAAAASGAVTEATTLPSLPALTPSAEAAAVLEAVAAVVPPALLEPGSGPGFPPCAPKLACMRCASSLTWPGWVRDQEE